MKMDSVCRVLKGSNLITTNVPLLLSAMQIAERELRGVGPVARALAVNAELYWSARLLWGVRFVNEGQMKRG